MASKEIISTLIEARRSLIIEVADQIWDLAETRFQECRSARLLCDVLEQEGFTVRKNVADMPTAFVASYGNEGASIGILAEYDGLSAMSQQANIAEKKPAFQGQNGHGCGHNALGAGAMAAAIAIKDYLRQNRLPGKISCFGCPGEEGGSGKTFMVREKVFDGLDVALSWHPDTVNGVISASTSANIQSYFKFNGISSHAAISPYLGRSALDAVELMNVGVNYLREHIIPEARIHYAITNGGGLSPNVVPAQAEVLYLVRAPKVKQTREIYERVIKVAEGAALMTGTTCEVVFDKAVSDFVPNSTLDRLLYQKMIELGPAEITGKDLQYAEDIWKSLEEHDRQASLVGLDKDSAQILMGKRIADVIIPYGESDQVMPESTDVGDVSWVVPTSKCVTACYALGTPFHSWQLVAQGKSELCHKNMLLAAKVLALSALELYEKPEIINQAKIELTQRLDGERYMCPIPPSVKPAIVR